MSRLLITFILFFSFILISSVTIASENNGSYFVGLWQGIDPEDGSEVLRSIIKNDDGTFSIIGYETNLIGCGNTDKGKITATGQIENGVLFSTDFKLECYDIDTSSFGQSTPDLSVEYVPDKKNNILMEQFVDTPFQPVILHMISK